MDEKEKLDELQAQATNALERIASIRRNFTGLRQYLDVQISEILPFSKDTPKTSAKKLEELQSVQVTLMKAEEAFNEKYQPDDEADIDFDVLRDQIGRALDRIRELEGSMGVYRRDEREPD